MKKRANCGTELKEEQDKIEQIHLANDTIVLSQNKNKKQYALSAKGCIDVAEYKMSLKEYIELVKSDCEKYNIKTSFEFNLYGGKLDINLYFTISCAITFLDKYYDFFLIKFPHNEENINYMLENIALPNEVVTILKEMITIVDSINDENKLKLKLM